MAISFTCTCGRTIAAPDAEAGGTFRCPYCGDNIDVPDPLAQGEETAPLKLTCPRCGALRELTDAMCPDCGAVYGAQVGRRPLAPPPGSPTHTFGWEVLHAFVYPLAPGGLFLILATAVIVTLLAPGVADRGVDDLLVVAAVLSGWFADFLFDVVQTSAGGVRKFPVVFRKPDYGPLETLLLALSAVAVSGLLLIVGVLLVLSGVVEDPRSIPWTLLGTITCLYLPGALLAVAVWRSPLAAGPHVVVPAALKAPLAMLTASVILGAGAFIHYRIFDPDVLKQASLFDPMPMLVVLVGNLMATYLYFVAARVIGITHWVYRKRIGWFKRD